MHLPLPALCRRNIKEHRLSKKSCKDFFDKLNRERAALPVDHIWFLSAVFADIRYFTAVHMRKVLAGVVAAVVL